MLPINTFQMKIHTRRLTSQREVMMQELFEKERSIQRLSMRAKQNDSDSGKNLENEYGSNKDALLEDLTVAAQV